MAGNNNVSEIIYFDESAVINSPEVHSTPNVEKDDKNVNMNVTSETNITDDSGIQITPKLSRESKTNDNEVSFTDNKTESKVMKDIEYQSTPIQNKQTVDNNDVMNMLQLILEQQSMKFNEQNKFDTKFDELKVDINNVKNKRVSQCNELKRDMEKVVESVEKQIKTKPNQVVDTTISNSGNMTTNSEEINDKVCTDDYNEMLTSNNNDIKNGDVIENGV